MGDTSVTDNAPRSSHTDQLSCKNALYLDYPVNSVMELILSPGRKVVRGLVYCTDETSNVVVLKRSLTHTTLSSDVRVVNASCITEKKILRGVAASEDEEIGACSLDNDQFVDGQLADIGEEKLLPLLGVSRRVLEERERRAIRLSEESFRHINQKASPEGQAVFDRLLKACNEVVWRNESILVLNQIQVDPPYRQENCFLVASAGAGEAGLERVKKIVAATCC